MRSAESASIQTRRRGWTACAASAPTTPRRSSTAMALGASCSPAPSSPNSGDFSTTCTRRPRRASASAVARPPMPPPTIRVGSLSTIVTGRCSSLHLAPTPVAGRQSEVALEGTAESGFRLVAGLIGDRLDRQPGRFELLPGEAQTPMGEVLHRRLIEKALEALGERGARHADPTRQLLHRPILEWLGVQASERGASDRIVVSGEPADLV